MLCTGSTAQVIEAAAAGAGAGAWATAVAPIIGMAVATPAVARRTATQRSPRQQVFIGVWFRGSDAETVTDTDLIDQWSRGTFARRARGMQRLATATPPPLIWL